jgi:hypothetical protein
MTNCPAFRFRLPEQIHGAKIQPALAGLHELEIPCGDPGRQEQKPDIRASLPCRRNGPPLSQQSPSHTPNLDPELMHAEIPFNPGMRERKSLGQEDANTDPIARRASQPPEDAACWHLSTVLAGARLPITLLPGGQRWKCLSIPVRSNRLLGARHSPGIVFTTLPV